MQYAAQKIWRNTKLARARMNAELAAGVAAIAAAEIPSMTSPENTPA